MTDDEDVPSLPADTLAILEQFYKEQSKEDQEDWQLSQFWYDEKTTTALCNAVSSLCRKDMKAALLCCPTLCQHLIDKGVALKLLEFDNRFKKYGDVFQFYDYKEPLDIHERLHHTFDVIVADPPFLSEECLSKVCQTINLLKKDETCKIILCTGAVMTESASRLASLKTCSFLPKHKNNLANEFRCYTNFGELPG